MTAAAAVMAVLLAGAAQVAEPADRAAVGTATGAPAPGRSAITSPSAPVATASLPTTAGAATPGPGRPASIGATSPARAGDQYLYGSGEAAALSRATWAALVDYVTRALAQSPRQGVVLADDATLAAPRFVACGAKPPVVVADVDETALLNVGWQYDDARAGGRPFDAARWRRWEQDGAALVAPTPGAIEAAARLRALGVGLVFVTNRDAAFGAATAQALDGAGLGPVEVGRTLFLRAAGASPAKDAARARVAADHCVLALIGDQLGDFSDLFDRAAAPPARRAATAVPAVADLWGEGWFPMPNPVYGSALRGGVDELFPPAQRWTDPGPAAAPPPSPAAAPPAAPGAPTA